MFDEDSRELMIPFEYRPLREAEVPAYGTSKQQENIIDAAARDIPQKFADNAEALSMVEPQDLLRTHLTRYTHRNTSDYFVHKDLKGFLERELDFYLKNEVLDLDNLDAAGPERAEGWFETMRAVKSLGREIIAFLAQIEDFQKNVFEKKKFVVQADYCLTLDNVPEDLYGEVAESEAQYEEWENLFTISEVPANLENGNGDQHSIEWLKANPHLVLDTKFFSQDFKDRLLASIEDLDEKTDGLLIESENFQALNLLQERYREQVKCIYIDPPYNTAASEILYKNDYKHSSWLTLAENRIREARPLLGNEGILCVTIDDAEFHRLYSLLLRIFGGEEAILGTAVIRSNPSGRSTVRGFQIAHEYGVFVANSEHVSVGRVPRTEKQLARYKESDEQGSFEWVNFRKHGGADANRFARPKMFYPIYVSDEGVVRIPQMRWNASEKAWIIDEQPGSNEEIVYPVSANNQEKRWKWGHESVLENISSFRAGSDQEGRTGVYMKSWMKEEGTLPLTWWDKKEYSATEYGTNFLGRIVGDVSTFSFPKSLYANTDCLRVSNLGSGDVCLDFFAGSGTTGHAVIELNRQDSGDRRYILVEVGEYFDTVLKPRIQKVIYSKDWKDGKPVSREGTSHIFKYMNLESYEDALDNIAFAEEEGQEALAIYGDDYLLRYMLDFETRDSDALLNVDKLASPFDYKLALRDGEESRNTVVDLPETFAYLIGLRVASRRTYFDGERRYLVYRGATPDRDDVAVVWRDVTNWQLEDLERDKDFVEESGMADEAQVIFVNGGDTLTEGARPLDGVFKRLMVTGAV